MTDHKRYAVSLIAPHSCCNEACVLDMSKPSDADPSIFQVICECYSLDVAEKIAAALNYKELQ